MDEAGEHVPPERVGAEEEGGLPPVGPGRWDEKGAPELFVRRIRRDQRRKDGDQDEREEDDEADDRAAVGREVVPELRQHRRPHPPWAGDGRVGSGMDGS